MKNFIKKQLHFISLVLLGVCLLSLPVLAEQNTKTNLYLVPECDSRYYTEGDLNNMTLQTICFAKNEIYARHGRKFVSKELREYFESQSWYSGTVEPGNFTETVFNQYEQANVTFLSNQEFKRASNGYQLDQPGYTYEDVKKFASGSTAPALNEGIEYNRETKELKTNFFSFTVPTSWVGEWSYHIDSADSISFYCKAVREEKSVYDGWLGSIYRSTEKCDEDYFPSADYLGESEQYYYYLLYPTDVRFDPDSSRSRAVYTYMSEHTSDIVSTFQALQ